MDLSETRTRLALTLAVGLGGVSMVTGCTAVPSTPQADGTDRLEVHGTVPPLSNPLRSYGQDPQVISALARAVDVLTEECMDTFGLEYQRQDYDALDRSFLIDETRLYGITDPLAAAKYGYLPPPSRSSGEVPPAAPESYQFVLTGLQPADNPAELDLDRSPGTVAGLPVPPAGCLGQARLELTGSVTERPSSDAELGHFLYNEAWHDAWISPTTQLAKMEWSQCMKAKGHDATDPLDDIPAQTSFDPSGSEVKFALADIACKQSTDFVAKANAENVRIAQSYLDENFAELRASKEFNDNALSKARAVIDAAENSVPRS